MLTPAQDADHHTNLAPNAVSASPVVNTIGDRSAISLLTSDGKLPQRIRKPLSAGLPRPVGKSRCAVRHCRPWTRAAFYQVQRLGNPLVNELVIGTGYKDRWSMEQPKNDAQFLFFAF